MSKCENIICQLVDSAADTKLKRLKPGEIFGVEKPGGEARIYVGQTSNEDYLDKFFGFDHSETVKFLVSKADLLDYLLRAKEEFINPMNSYRLRISDFYESLVSQTIALEDEFFIEFKKNTDKRYYLSPVLKKDNPYGRYVRSICLPLLTTYNFIKTIDEQGNVRYYFKLIFANNENVLKSLSLPNEKVIEILSPYLRAMRTKPFLLLAGISGTGKSRIVRQLARACWPVGSEEAKAHKPSNFEMVQVKPNWHDSSELLGYVSRIGDKPEFIAGDFLKFIAKAWENPEIPHFLCLDEMNLAPVEQYFAEYLSVVESRKLQDDGKTILTDPILDKVDAQWYYDLVASLVSDTVKEDFLKNGIRIPQNLIVVGTVNMDETTYSFSRKVLDRAMTIEMNEVNLSGGLRKEDDAMPFIPADNMLADAVEGYDVYPGNEDISENVISYLEDINNVLADTPFRIAYRTRNEFLIYVVNAIRLAGKDADQYRVMAKALDEVTSMKILSRIEGDKRKVDFLPELKDTVKRHLDLLGKEEHTKINSVSIAKLDTMTDRLRSGYTSFWD